MKIDANDEIGEEDEENEESDKEPETKTASGLEENEKS